MYEGQLITVLMQLVFAGVLLYLINHARSGKKLAKIRRLAGLDALDEAIGRATEMGRPIMYFPGQDGLSNAQTLASFSVLEYVSKSCARYDTRLIAVCSAAAIYSVMEGIVHQSYVSSGAEDRYDPTSVRFLASGWGAFTSAAQGTMKREQIAAALYFGGFYAEAMLLSEVGSMLGAIQVASTANTGQLPFFIAACDYTLIGEELYAASAYLSTDPVMKANLVALDYGKIVTVIILVVGIVSATLGNTWLKDFLSM